MIDIHPPQHAAMTRRDFFIHLFTVVLGILIALGLEQAIEHLHERHQLQMLREGAIDDARVYVHDVDQLRLANRQQIEDLSVRIQQVHDALSHHQALPPPAYRPVPPTNTVRLSNLSAGQAGGLIHLLSEPEIASATEGEVGVATFGALKERAQETTRKRLAFEQRFQPIYPSGPVDFSTITSAQLDQYLGLLLDERVLRTETLAFLDEMHRGGEAFLHGERDLEKVRAAEVDSSSPR